jgi:hypothetical protein
MIVDEFVENKVLPECGRPHPEPDEGRRWTPKN